MWGGGGTGRCVRMDEAEPTVVGVGKKEWLWVAVGGESGGWDLGVHASAWERIRAGVSESGSRGEWLEEQGVYGSR